jgi:selenocysteine-specific elongation factor
MRRGMTLAPPGLFAATPRVDGVLSLLPTARPLKNHAKVHFHCGTAEMLAEVVLLDGKELRPGEHAYAQLRLSEHGLFLPGDRFIIRQLSPVTTIGGGVVLDNQPLKHRLGDPWVQEFLAVLERGDPAARLELLVQQSGAALLSALVARTGWQASEVVRVGKALEDKNRLALLGQPPTLLVHRECFQALAKRLLDELEEFHAANPLLAGLSKEELRARGASGRPVPPTLSSPMLFNAVLQALGTQGKVDVQGETVRLAGRQIQLTAEELAAQEQISRAFEKAGLAVPSAQEVLASLRIDRARAEKLLQILLKESTLLRVTEDLIFHRSALQGLRELLAGRKAQSNRINVAIFKEITGLSRKYAIPLLEYLDRERVTRREGDERIIL